MSQDLPGIRGFFDDLGRPHRLVDFSARVGDEALPDGFKTTRAFDDILEGLALGRRIRASLVLVSGQNGAGKTTVLRWYAAERTDAVYWECRAGYRPNQVLADILSELPVPAQYGWGLRTKMALEYLTVDPRVFLLDEAQRLSYDSLDLLKYIADNSGSMFVLAASPSLESRIEKWPDIASRCPVRVHVCAMEKAEFVELYQNEGFSVAVLEEMHHLTRGVMRTVRALLLVVDDYLALFNERTGSAYTRANLEPGHVRQIAKKVVPVPIVKPRGGATREG